MNGEASGPQKQYSPRLSHAARSELHSRLDDLLDLDEEINEAIWHHGISDDLTEQLSERAESLTIRVSRLASQVASGNTRAIAFRNNDPTSREALAHFLKGVAAFAAPYHFATANFGIQTFTWTDVIAVLEDLQSLDFGDIPSRLLPADKRRKRAVKFSILKEQWRAVLWVSYLEAEHMKEAAVKEVAMAYHVSDRTIYNWERATSAIRSGRLRDQEREAARRAGEESVWPDFSLSSYAPAGEKSYREWLEHDAKRYISLVNADA